MLTKIRDSSRSLVFYVLGGIVVAVLILSFGTPGVGGGAGRPSGTSAIAASVGGQKVTADEYRQIAVLGNLGQMSVEEAKMRRAKEGFMDQAIRRALLLQEAHALGLEASTAEAEDSVLDGNIVFDGREIPAPVFLKDERFDWDQFERYVRSWGMRPNDFIEMQRKEITAARMRSVLASSVVVSPSEVQRRYETENTKINLEYIRVPVAPYEDRVEPSAAEIAAYVEGNGEAISEAYEQKKFMYEKLPAQKKLSFVAALWGDDADERAKAEALRRAQGWALQLKRGKSFAALARELRGASREQNKSARLGWRTRGATGLGDAIDEAIFGAADAGEESGSQEPSEQEPSEEKPSEQAPSGQVAANVALSGPAADALVGPVEGTDGIYLVSVQGAREGDVSLEEASADIAEGLLRKSMASEQAKAFASAALEEAKAALSAGKATTLLDVFPRPEEGDVATGAGARPVAAETGLFPKRGVQLRGLGMSKELAKEAWSLIEDSPFAGPTEVAGAFVVVRLAAREEADLSVFEESRGEFAEREAEVKGYLVAQEWLNKSCEAFKNAGGLEVDKAVLTYGDDEVSSVNYEPCAASPFGF